MYVLLNVYPSSSSFVFAISAALPIRKEIVLVFYSNFLTLMTPCIILNQYFWQVCYWFMAYGSAKFLKFKNKMATSFITFALLKTEDTIQKLSLFTVSPFLHFCKKDLKLGKMRKCQGCFSRNKSMDFHPITLFLWPGIHKF